MKQEISVKRDDWAKVKFAFECRSKPCLTATPKKTKIPLFVIKVWDSNENPSCFFKVICLYTRTASK